MRRPKLWLFEGGEYTTKQIHEQFCKTVSINLVYLRLSQGASTADEILRRPKTSSFSHPKWTWLT